MTAEQIVSDFNALLSTKKPTLGDIIRDFHKYVGEHEKEIAANITLVLNNFLPESNLGKLLRIKLVNKYQVHDEVLTLLKSGDSLNVNQALKCKWFFADVPDPENFTKNFVPCLSLSTRLKVLNKYASCLTNTKAAEVIYESVKSRYGIRTAVSILPACGENFIRNELPNVKITLLPGIVLLLYKNYPSLTTEYIKYLAENSKKRNDLSSYETVLVKLASKDLATFLEITGKHKDHLPCIKLGRRPTKRLLKTRKTEVIDNYTDYKWLLKDKIFFSRISLEQVTKIYINDLLPSNIAEFLMGARMASMKLEFFKSVVQSDIILTSFKTKYGREMTADDVLYSLEEIWVKHLPLESQVKWLERKIQENISDPEWQGKYLAQLPIEKSMPRLKQLIESQSNANVRVSLAGSMVKTLKINKCSSGIKDLFAYFVKRFRNETKRFHSTIVVEMSEIEQLFLDMEPNDWTPIMEFVNIMKLNHELYDDYGVENALVKVFDYRVQNSLLKNGDVNACLNDYLDLATGDKKSCNYQYLKLGENSPHRNFCLQWLLNVVPKMSWADASFAQGFHARLYEHLVAFNCKNPDSQIPCPAWLRDSIDKIAEDEEASYLTTFTVLKCAKKADVQLWQSILKRTVLRYMNCETMCAILRFEPTFILENIFKVMEKTIGSVGSYKIFYKKSRLFDVYGIPAEIAKLCLVNLKLQNAEFDLDKESNLAAESLQPNAVGTLAIILPSSEFLSFALRFAPTASKVEEYSEETQALHDIQKAIGKSFKDVPSAEDVLPVLQKFAVGDYLKFVSESIVAVCVRVPENKILPILKASIDCPVSLRKHYLKLLYKIAPTEERIQIFVSIFKTEKNVSLRLVLFQLLRKAFIDEPDEDTYRMFQSILTQLTEEDVEALKALYSVEHYQDEFVGRYLELIWELSGSKWAAVIPKGKSDIVNLVTCSVIKLLSEDFCNELLSFELSEKFPSECPSGYLSVYLLHAPTNEIQASRWSNVMANLQPLIKSCWDEYKFASCHVFPVRHIVSELVNKLCLDAPRHVKCSAVHPVQLLESAKKSLSGIIKPSQFLGESLEIDLTIKTLQHNRSNLPRSGLVSSVIDLYKTYLQTHSQYQYPLIRCIVSNAPSDVKKELALALTSDANPICQIIGIELLSSHISTENEVSTYKALIENLSSSDNPAVQAMAHNFFCTLTSSEL